MTIRSVSHSVAELGNEGGGARLRDRYAIWLDPERDLVVVARWLDKASVDGLIARVPASVERC